MVGIKIHDDELFVGDIADVGRQMSTMPAVVGGRKRPREQSNRHHHHVPLASSGTTSRTVAPFLIRTHNALR